ncbi:MAG: lysophospholipid acyltransferase family protein [Granulosicoccus sp.]|nr:lysophospholipid acyltransferase family protein [Granulosicoccus sp.]
MPLPVVQFFAYLLGRLPLSANQSVGALLGQLAWLLRTRERCITEVNLQLCFPKMPAEERQILARNSLIETGKQFTECAWIWHQPRARLNKLIKESPGHHLLDEATRASRGLIVVSPHIGNWELCSLPVSQHVEFTYFYRKPRNASLAPLLIRWRARLGGQAASLDTGGIRKGLRILKQGGALGILPDQEPDRDNGLFSRFFDQPALTMTLLPKLAQRSGARVLLCVSERLPRARGWRVHYLEADPNLTHSDMDIALAAVNRDVERCIALCPEQYLWDYRRFQSLPDGRKRNYRISTPRP